MLLFRLAATTVSWLRFAIASFYRVTQGVANEKSRLSRCSIPGGWDCADDDGARR